MSRAERWAKKGREAKSFAKVEYLDLKPGQNILRIIPPFGDDEEVDFWREVIVSYGVGPNEKMIKRPDQYGKPDPIADEIAKLRKEGERLEAKKKGSGEASIARADEMAPKTRHYIFVIDRDEPEKGYQLWNGNIIILNEILAIFNDAQYGDITDPEEGVDITVNYTPGGKKRYPKWHINPRRNSTPLDHPEALEVDLFEKHNVCDASEYDYIVACLEGTEEEYKAARKAEREEADDDADAEGEGEDANENEGDDDDADAEGEGEDEAIKRKAAELKKKKAAAAAKKKAADKGKGKGKKPAAPKPPAPKGKKIGTPKTLLKQMWWVAIDGESEEKTGEEIQAMLDDDSTSVEYVTSVEDPGDWQTAEDLGFIQDVEQSQVGSDLEGAVSG